MGTEIWLIMAACLVTAAFSGWQLYSYRRDRLRGFRAAQRLYEHWLEWLQRWFSHQGEKGPADWGATPNQWSPPPAPPQPAGDERTATALAAVLIASLVVAAGTAVLDAKLSDASNGPSQSGGGSAQPERPGDDRGGLGEADRAAFDGEPIKRVRVSRKRRGRLCLVRFGPRTFGSSEGDTGRWWTSCRRASDLATIEDVKEELALPARFGAVRDLRVRASIPAGTRIVYFEGPVAAQCEHEDDSLPCKGHRYAGGGWQYLFPRPGRLRRWIVAVECTRQREDRPSRWTPCAG